MYANILCGCHFNISYCGHGFQCGIISDISGNVWVDKILHKHYCVKWGSLEMFCTEVRKTCFTCNLYYICRTKNNVQKKLYWNVNKSPCLLKINFDQKFKIFKHTPFNTGFYTGLIHSDITGCVTSDSSLKATQTYSIYKDLLNYY
jgi:hypothetical protein